MKNLYWTIQQNKVGGKQYWLIMWGKKEDKDGLVICSMKVYKTLIGANRYGLKNFGQKNYRADIFKK